MKKILPFAYIIILAIFFSSCDIEDDNKDCNFNNCKTDFPSTGLVTIKVSNSDTNTGIPVSIYEGYFDTGTLLEEDTIFKNKKTYELASEMYYTFVAEYSNGGDTIYAIDGGKINIKSQKECDSVCYSVQDLYLNLKLHY